MNAQNYLSFDSYLAENLEECLKPEMQDFMHQNLIGNCYYVILNAGQSEFLKTDAKNDYFEQLKTLHKSQPNKINGALGNSHKLIKPIETRESPTVNNLQKEPTEKTITDNFFKLTKKLGSNNLLKNFVISLSQDSTNLALKDTDKKLKLSEILNKEQMFKYNTLKDEIKQGLNKGTTKDDEEKYISAINDNLRKLLFENLNITPETNKKIKALLPTETDLAGGGDSDAEYAFGDAEKSRQENRRNRRSKKQENVQPIIMPSEEVTFSENDIQLNKPSAEITSPQTAPENEKPLNEPSAEENEQGYQKLRLHLDDSNYDGAYLFIFKLDVNQENIFNNKHLFDNICSGNYVGVGDYVNYTTTNIGGLVINTQNAGIIKKVEYLNVGKVICQIQPIDPDTKRQIGNVLHEVEMNMVKPFSDANKNVIKPNPIKYINGITIKLSTVKTLIEKANNLVKDTIDSENRLIENKYGKNGLILSNLLQDYQTNESLPTLLFLLANKIGFNILGNNKPVQQGVKNTRRDAKQTTDDDSFPNTIRDEIPNSIYLSTFTKLLFDILYKSNNGILYKTAQINTIRNGKCNIDFYKNSQIIKTISDVTIYEKNFEGMLNNSAQLPIMDQLSYLLEKYNDYIRFILLYFSSPSSGNYFGCKIENYYNIFLDKINTNILIYYLKQKDSYHKYLRSGEKKEDAYRFGRTVYDTFKRNDSKPAESKPAESKPAKKPTEEKPTEEKPAESKPATSNPSEEKPPTGADTSVKETEVGGYKKRKLAKTTKKVRKSKKRINYKKKRNVTKKIKRSKNKTHKNN